MPKPFFTRLQKYFADVGQVLQGQAGVASIFPNSSDVGMSREQVYAEVLKQHLPANCAVAYGGFLFDTSGSESRQIDVIVINDKSVRFNFFNQNGSGKTFAYIDGCVAVASIKSHLSSEQLREALENIASIPDKQPREGKINPFFHISDDDYNDWPFKIIYANSGVSMETCYTTLTSFYNQNPDIPIHKRPNIIHVAGQYYLFRSLNEHTVVSGEVLLAGEFMGRSDLTDVFSLLFAVLSIQKIAAKSNQISYSYDSLLNALSAE